MSAGAPTSGFWRASQMTMTRTQWAKLHGGKAPLEVVLRGADVIAVVWCGDDEDGEEAANARILAAAKELLAALTDARDALRTFASSRRVTGPIATHAQQAAWAASEAIAKAEAP